MQLYRVHMDKVNGKKQDESADKRKKPYGLLPRIEAVFISVSITSLLVYGACKLLNWKDKSSGPEL